MDLSGFLNEWNGPSDSMTVHTSGSTGRPKELIVQKSRMLASARTTCDFLGLKKGDRALLCMPLDYIACKMMVVRSIERGLKLVSVTPCNHPFAGIPDSEPPFDLVAMVPSQVYCTLSVPREAELLKACRHLIIGGGAVNRELVKSLRGFPNAVWSSYGMTETLSHIALRRINGPHRSDLYKAFAGIRLGLTPDSCLTIEAPGICDGTLVTNDIATLSPDGRHFRIIGRKDNVICSGGIKLHAEQIEAVLSEALDFPFCITKRPDPKFGETAVLLIEDGPGNVEKARAARDHLDRFSRPKAIICTERIPLTGTGKIDRAEATLIAQALLCKE